MARTINKTTSTIKMFLKEVSSYPMLEGKEEKMLFCELSSLKGLKDEDSVMRYNEIVKHITASNMRLVVSIANKFVNGSNMDVMDLYQEGANGLMNAVMKYDHTKGIKFSTYATNWINADITRAIDNQSRTIRIPVYLKTVRNKIEESRRQLRDKLGREATLDEVSLDAGISVDDIINCDIAMQKSYSLDTKISGEDESTFSDFVCDDSMNPEERVAKTSQYGGLKTVVSMLPEFEKKVISYIYGMSDDMEHTRAEASKYFNCSKETIRLTEIKALNRIRNDKEMMAYIN